MNIAEVKKDIAIRDYTEKDYNQVAELWLQTELGNPVRGDDAETIKRTLNLGGKLLVMELQSSGIIIGTSWMTTDGRRMLLHHFGILPDYQGKGLSKTLLKESLKFVKKANLQVKLEVHAQNQRAIELYDKFGFKILPGYSIYIIRDLSKL